MLALEKKVQTWLRDAQLWPRPQPVLVGCSGGPDSIALAQALLRIGQPVALAHVNYGLRGTDADADEALVRELGATWQVPVHVRRPQHEAGMESVQLWARSQRYAFFEELMDRHGYWGCATAHHSDDQAETLLLSLLRSQEAPLWHGIPPRRDRYLRPLLGCTKTEVLTYLAERALPFREDLSNQKPQYLRNHVRLEVLPALRAIHPSVEEQLRQRHQWYQQDRKSVV